MDWVTPEDIADLFADVPYVLHYSRHHMKPKGEKSARPRFHIVFLIDPERDADRYTALKQRLLAAFPFFDANAMDAARFLFGTEDPQVIYHPGTITLNAFLDDLENEQAFANIGRTIPEGSRNSTMSRIGARDHQTVRRYPGGKRAVPPGCRAMLPTPGGAGVGKHLGRKATALCQNV